MSQHSVNRQKLRLLPARLRGSLKGKVLSQSDIPPAMFLQFLQLWAKCEVTEQLN